jgi:hypothetical protein
MEKIRTRFTPFGWAALALSTIMTLGLFVLLGALLFGCAELGGVVRYDHDGPVVLHAQLVHPPEAPRSMGMASGGHVFDYWHAPVTVIVTVDNGRPYPVKVTLDCGNYMPTVTVQPHTGQKILVDTDMVHYYGEDTCEIFSQERVPLSQ